MTTLLQSLALLSLLLQAPASAGVRISGRVVDGETGTPLENATVTLASRGGNAAKRTTTAGPNGQFQFVSVPRGAYQLHTEHPRPTIPYRSESLEIDIADRDITDMGLILTPAVPRISLTGRVVMAGGGPLPATVSALRLSSEVIPIERDGAVQLRMRPLEKYTLGLQNPSEGLFIESASGGVWDAASGVWTIRDKPSSPVQITLGVGQQRISGRILSASRVPAAQATVTLIGPAPTQNPRPVTLGQGATFSVTGLRPGNYEIRAQIGAGDGTQAGSLKLTVDAQNREAQELVLKGMTAMTGQVLVTGRALEDLMRFKPYVELEDALGTRRIAFDSKGTFQFRSFEDEFSLGIRDLPIELRVQSITTGPSSVTIRIGTQPGDGPEFFRFRVPEIR